MRDFPHDCGMVDTYGFIISEKDRKQGGQSLVKDINVWVKGGGRIGQKSQNIVEERN